LYDRPPLACLVRYFQLLQGYLNATYSPQAKDRTKGCKGCIHSVSQAVEGAWTTGYDLTDRLVYSAAKAMIESGPARVEVVVQGFKRMLPTMIAEPHSLCPLSEGAALQFASLIGNGQLRKVDFCRTGGAPIANPAATIAMAGNIITTGAIGPGPSTLMPAGGQGW